MIPRKENHMFKLLNSSQTPAEDLHPYNSLISNWLRLNNIPNIGYIRLSKSATKLNCDLSALLSKTSSQLASIGWSNEQVSAISINNSKVIAQVQGTLNWLSQSANNHFVSIECAEYPYLLRQISRPPLFLYVCGDITLLSRPQIAFVGSRNASFSAVQTTHDLIQGLAKHTVALSVSGLALGIDAACHQASLANNLPTIGVLGCGIDVVYPKRHKQLYKDVAGKGALVSEFLLGTNPVATMFVRRNRIISGISLGTVVVEARIKSGSLVTAKYAMEQNREVFAVPSNVNNPNSQGCHWLIKQGAKLTENIQDVLDEVPCIVNETSKVVKKSFESLESDPLLDSVGYTATSVDSIAKRTGMSLNKVLLQLLEYELRGLVASTAQGYVKLKA
jgi:DNA processing protein